MSPENGRTAYVTFAGTPKYATKHVHARRVGMNGAPSVASERAYLRSGLPAVYHERDRTNFFGVRFVGALETVLDPIVGVLDSLHAHVDPDLAPEDILELLAAWLGLELDEAWPLERRRDIVHRAGELARARGTQRGLELFLSIAFHDLPLRVEDGGGVSWTTDPDAPPPEQKPEFAVYCDQPLTEQQQAAVARTIEQAKPVHVGYRLRVKRPRKQD
jgi:phage tail-like protein